MSIKKEIEERAAALADILEKCNTALASKGLDAAVDLSKLAAAIHGIRRLRIATGTFFPTEDCTSITIPIVGTPCAVSVAALDSYEQATGDIIGASYDIFPWRDKMGRNGNVIYCATSSSDVRNTSCVAVLDDKGISFPEFSQSFFWRASKEYRWTAYYWESLEDMLAAVPAGEPIAIDGLTYYGTGTDTADLSLEV